jgi:hypothetical protein
MTALTANTSPGALIAAFDKLGAEIRKRPPAEHVSASTLDWLDVLIARFERLKRIRGAGRRDD